jgi:hypothetical protein
LSLALFQTSAIDSRKHRYHAFTRCDELVPVDAHGILVDWCLASWESSCDLCIRFHSIGLADLFDGLELFGHGSNPVVHLLCIHQIPGVSAIPSIAAVAVVA